MGEKKIKKNLKKNFQNGFCRASLYARSNNVVIFFIFKELKYILIQ